MKLYNTLSNKKEEFKSINPDQVTMYNCGPTVYDYAHIGNWRSFLVADFLKRTLEYIGYDVKQVMNLTDVGHLTSDADQGQDKVEKRARQERKTASQITDFYINAFKKDQQRLNISLPEKMPRATQHIEEMVSLVKTLEKKGYTYKTSDGIYFDTAKFKNYGKLSGQKLEEKKAGARIELSEEKRNPTDFAVWKFSPKNEKRQQEWDSPWGVGFPGWHIECSVLSTKYLGQPFDIHTGGVDHIGVHHENEIAQSEAAYDKLMANYWFHINFLKINSEKISKSEKNFYTIGELEQKGYHPLAFRLLIFSAHYRKEQNFTFESLEQAQSNLEKIYRTVQKIRQIAETGEEKSNSGIKIKNYKKEFRQALKDDLNTPEALAVVLNLVREVNKEVNDQKISSSKAQEIYQLFINMDQVLGIKINEKASQTEEIPEMIKKLVTKREKLRKSKNWSEADQVRQKIRRHGYEIEDTDQGTQVYPANN